MTITKKNYEYEYEYEYDYEYNYYYHYDYEYNYEDIYDIIIPFYENEINNDNKINKK